MYFVEQEKKWTIILNQMKDKVKYYKDLCKLIIAQKNKHLNKIERINDVLFNRRLSVENLDDHKSLIQDLLKVVNEKREEIYLIRSRNEILNNELEFWLYNFEELKLNNLMRERMKNIDIKQIVKNISDEMAHKK